MSFIVPAVIALLSIILPGFFLALALLRKTKLNMFEIAAIGFMFGLAFPPTLTWLESYLMGYIPFFSFSVTLYEMNVILLTLIGIGLSAQQGVLDFSFIGGAPSPMAASESHEVQRARLAEVRERVRELKIDTSLVKEHQDQEHQFHQRHAEEEHKAAQLHPDELEKLRSIHAREEADLIAQHEREERELLGEIQPQKGMNWVWAALLFLMLFTFATRMLSIGIAPRFFEFDPYFDMQSTEFLLSHGYQWLYDRSAWPTAINGTPHRIEPIVPYIEAYWYELSNPPATQIDQTLLSTVSGVYPPVAAALLVFIVFMFLYHTYGEKPAIIGAALATAMPALITTFIAGEQLLEPWGIFSMFFFYTAFLLAVQNQKEPRFAILAGLAFAASFLGAHYYSVISGVFAIYIALQGTIDVLRKRSNKDFYRMNLIIIAIITFFYALFNPYNTVLTNKIPSVLGIPVIVSFPALSLLFVFILERVPLEIHKRGIIKLPGLNLNLYLAWLAVLGVIALVLIFATPLGKPFKGYLELSTRYTTPSIPLFMTVQEFEPTGFNFNFGPAGFGIIGASFFGVNVLVWFVLIVFTILSALAIYNRDSKGSILSISAVWPLAIAGMIEIKYLPHFGVGYIIAFSIIIGELLLAIKKSDGDLARKIILGFAVAVVLLESTVFVNIASAAGASCQAISQQGNAIGFDIFCNTIPQEWLNAMSWLKQNVGPLSPRVLSWWDYGDWINWFGNSNAVLRGDNSIAQLDYATAARFVLGPNNGFGPANLANFSDRVANAKYVLFDDQITAKWQALNFLACVYVNQTSKEFAESEANGTSSPYVLGTSRCETSHAPAYLLVPVDTNNINNYCQFASQNIKTTALKTALLANNQISNQTFCAPLNLSSGSEPVRMLDSNGSKTNVLLIPTQQFFAGINRLGGGQQFLTFIALYLPNGPNNTITNAPTQFYNSNYYRGFYLGSLPGFRIVYPSDFTGVNFVNDSHPVVIYQINNYTGPQPTLTPKPPWVVNNFTMPG